jgi:hypothetical protein
MRQLPWKWVLFLALLSTNGCITGSLVTIGTVLGALGTAASTGSDVYKLGKLDAVLNRPAADCHRAVLASAGDLGLSVIVDDQTDLQFEVWEMTLHDERNSPVGIHIERRTGKMCRCRVDVGFFGSEPTARLMMERIRANLGISAEDKVSAE